MAPPPPAPLVRPIIATLLYSCTLFCIHIHDRLCATSFDEQEPALRPRPPVLFSEVCYRRKAKEIYTQHTNAKRRMQRTLIHLRVFFRLRLIFGQFSLCFGWCLGVKGVSTSELGGQFPVFPASCHFFRRLWVRTESGYPFCYSSAELFHLGEGGREGEGRHPTIVGEVG